MPRIRQLPATVVNKIAAGEVLERPGSAVKEMLENAIDAGARSVTVEIVEGGRDLIRIVDDGCGIPREELVLAVQAHATSKLETEADLFRIRTLGFRGEALSSIAGVSDFRLQSRPADQPVGAAIEVCHGEVGPVLDCGAPQGTQIEVRNLFASVPVRRKFLKSKQTELGHISEAMTRLALAYPAIALELIHNARSVMQRPGGLSLEESIGHLFGKEVRGALIPVESEGEGVRLRGFVCDPSVNRPNGTMQYLFVNGRFIRDRSLGHALAESYRGLIMTGRYPVAFLFIDMPVDEVDVNVHPTKIEVRFQDPHQIYSQLLSTIRGRFLGSDLTARLKVDTAEGRGAHRGSPPLEAGPTPAVAGAARTAEVAARQASRDAVRHEFSLSRSQPATSGHSLFPAPSADDRRSWSPPAMPMPSEHSPPSRPLDRSSDADRRDLNTGALTLGEGLEARDERPLETGPRPTPRAGVPRALPAEEPVSSMRAPETRSPRRALQLHNSYLVVETEEGMLLIDQHALHERILYEELRQRVASEAVEIQELLVPEPVELRPVEVGLVLEQREVLAALGLRVEEFGDRCVLLQSHPVMLRKLSPANLLRDIAHQLSETGKAPNRDQMLEDLLHMVACKAAVKAGDPLTPEEIDHLVALRDLCEDSHHCPHGRPTVLRFTLEELHKQFKRT